MDWLDASMPHDPDRSARQIDGLVRRLNDHARILDLGCGTGRVTIPLLLAGHDVTSVDHDGDALAVLHQRGVEAGVEPSTIAGEMEEVMDAVADQTWDAVLLLGNTFMVFHEIERAVGVLRSTGLCAAARGCVVLDDLPWDLWPELTQGRWVEGIDAEESMQMIWSDDDAVFAIRRGSDVDETCWTLQESDQRLRLWSRGALDLAASAAGLSTPRWWSEEGLMVMHPVRTSAGETCDEAM